MNAAKVLDAKGLACPLPIVRTKKAINELQSGQILEVHISDKGSLKDIPAWTESSGHEIVQQQEEESTIKFWIQKG